MTAYLVTRLLAVIPVMWGVATITFLVMHLLPGSAVQVLVGTDPNITPEQVRELERALGLDRPLAVQYMDWLIHVLTGDLGVSLRTHDPVLTTLLNRLPITVELSLASLLVALVIGVPAGIVSAVKRDGPIDLVVRGGSLLGLSLPNFWLGTMLILLASYVFRWLPPLGYVSLFENPGENLQTIALPSLALGVVSAAIVMRMVRSSFLDAYHTDYVRTAQAKGLSNRVVIFRHALKNALPPVVTVVGIQLGYLLGGAIVVEEIFGLPGVGRLVLYAIYQRDYPLIQGGVLFITCTFVLISLAVDILNAYLDPRVRYR